MKGKERKDIDTILEEALETAPLVEGYTIKEFSDVINSLWKVPRWHLERLDRKYIKSITSLSLQL